MATRTTPQTDGQTPKHPGGRPKGSTTAQDRIEQAQFEQLCKLQCTEAEVASFFGVNVGTLVTWISKTYDGRTWEDVFAEKSAGGRISMRRNLIRLSETNAAVAIFLAKNFLGMTDRQDVAVTHHDDDSARAMEAFFAAKKKRGKTGTGHERK